MKKLLSTIVFVVCLSAASYAFGTSTLAMSTGSTPSPIHAPQTAD